MDKLDQLKILIVDDNPNNLFSLTELIKENFPVKIYEANSGFEALRIINEQSIDLCLMDVQMPEMDGFETARLIKTRPKTGHIPVIFLTAFDPNKMLMEKGLHAGGLDYLTKPIDDVQIVHMLNMYLRFLERERNINSELEEKVQSRTSELQNSNRKLKLEIEERKKIENALLESEKKLQEAVAAKNQFFSIIAHDLRNPFNAVIGFSNFLKENLAELDKKEIDEYTGYINESANHAFVLLNNLLDWARSQTNMISFNPENINIAEIIDSTLSILSGEAIKKNIAVSNKVDEKVWTIADKNMISAVFRNLISNAIKFTNFGGKVSIFSNLSGGFHEFIIEDTGVGIKKEDIGKLFRIDTKIYTTGTAMETGTGLGLILCREFIGKNGGEIFVESEIGKGSRFKFSLPELTNYDIH
ncbi:MAG: hybrid sensor histidine kinase/response regulator [Bacteroidetes bacterium]|nr:hybrid sensor histidine kinase/response regulator [Bacteroidota bacterium]